jgi:hypothetical protein
MTTNKRRPTASRAGDLATGGESSGHGRAPGTRHDTFNPVGVWTAVAVMLLGCTGIGLGIILFSWWLIGTCTAAVVAGAALGWASGILNDTR